MKKKTLVKLIVMLYAVVAVTAGGLYISGRFPEKADSDTQAEKEDGRSEDKQINEEEYGIHQVGDTEASSEDVRLAQNKNEYENKVFVDNLQNEVDSSDELWDDNVIEEESDSSDDSPEEQESADLGNAADAEPVEVSDSDNSSDSEPEEISDSDNSSDVESAEVSDSDNSSDVESAEVSDSDNSSDVESAEVSDSDNSSDDETEQASEAATEDKTDSEKEAVPDNIVLFVTNVSTTLNVRSGPSLDSEIIGELKAGDFGYASEIGAEFAYITCGDISGYVSNEFILTGEEAEKKIRLYSEGTTGEKVKIVSDCYARSGPGTSYDILTTAWHGSVYPVADGNDEKSSWTAIILDDGRLAYVSSNYCKITD